MHVYTLADGDQIALLNMRKGSGDLVTPTWLSAGEAYSLADRLLAFAASQVPKTEGSPIEVKPNGDWIPPQDLVDVMNAMAEEAANDLCEKTNDTVINGSGLAPEAKKRRARFLNGVSRDAWEHTDRTRGLVDAVCQCARSPFNTRRAVAERAGISATVVSRLWDDKHKITSGYAEAIEKACKEILREMPL